MLVKRALFLLNAAFAMAILDLISQVHPPSFVHMLLKYVKYLKDSTFSSCFVFMHAETYWTKCSHVCGVYRQEVFWLCGAYQRQCSDYVGHNDRKCSGVCGAYRQEVFSCLWGILTGSVLLCVGHTDRQCSGVCGAY